MPPPFPATAHSATDFFSRALSSFQSSRSKLQIICTAPPRLHRRDGPDHGTPTPLPPSVPPRTLIVLDSSFNPPTRAHLRMATSAICDFEHRDSEGGVGGGVRLLLLLSVNNADKSPKPAAFDQRLAMMWAFASDVQHSVDVAEGEGASRVSKSSPGAFSVDLGLATVPYFHDKSAVLASTGFYHGQPDTNHGVDKTEQVFLVGYDTLIRIFNPKYYGPLDPAARSEMTPMQEALGPFFERAKLRMTMRADDEWGGAAEQAAYLETLSQADGLSSVGGSKEWGRRIKMVEGRKAGADVISSTYARAAAQAQDWDRLSVMVTPGVRRRIEQEGLYSQ
ncbi:hypothetical protein C8A05DRAFT_17506 [Staphylotrichum tortipilum]|uniref:Nicotinamide-nucleotide adenylyltransferase n=1 Tax=Staphylotrichum tortipilum TaxID=2831512 RepID=A0AAN6MG72_9PEZI|nr:hypothetical protein C8A05DRAFT_17506 [Staphylotrichum longicolle]